jgi:hypothetical protein
VDVEFTYQGSDRYTYDVPGVLERCNTICKEYAYGGYTDWEMPSAKEADLITKLEDGLYDFHNDYGEKRYLTSDGSWVKATNITRLERDPEYDYYVRPVRRF